MKKFNYKFETIKKIKETQEKQAQKEVASVDLEIEKWEEKKLKLLDDAKKAREEFPNVSITISDVAFHKSHQLVLKHMIEDAQYKIDELQRIREKKMKVLIEKTRETKMFESLKEKHFEKYMKEQNMLENSQIDEFATQKYIRGK